MLSSSIVDRWWCFFGRLFVYLNENLLYKQFIENVGKAFISIILIDNIEGLATQIFLKNKQIFFAFFAWEQEKGKKGTKKKAGERSK